jgi:hypothetical protein
MALGIRFKRAMAGRCTGTRQNSACIVRSSEFQRILQTILLINDDCRDSSALINYLMSENLLREQ